MLAPALTLLVLGTCTAPASAHPVAAAQVVRVELGRELDAYLTRLETFGLHGAILVERDGEVVLKQGYGVADHATGRRITGDTLFHLGSLGKQFTAAAVLTLVRDGKLDVAAPISTYLAGVPDDKAGVTVHHLLTHTSGLPYMPGPGAALALPLATPPGERWSYSNPGYSLLAAVVEAVSGRDFHAYVRAQVFEPAGLVQTFALGIEPGDVGAMAHAYTDETDQGTLADWDADGGFRGAGDFVSSLDDLVRWERCLRGNCVLPPALTEQVFTEHARNPGARTGYGYGWMTGTTLRGTRIFHHGGNLGGFNTDYRRYVDEGLTIVFLSNHFVNGRSMRDAVMNNVSLRVNGGGAALQPPRVARATAEGLARYTGRYRLASGAELDVTAAGGALEVRTESADVAGALFDPELDDEDRAFLAACLADSARILTDAARGDSALLRERLSPSLPYPGAWTGLQRQLTEIEGRLGAVRTVAPVCAMQTGGERAGKACVRLACERGEQLFQLTWSGGILHLAATEAVVPQRFAPLETPAGAENFAAYNIFSGVAVPLAIGEVDGVMTLTLRSPSGAITATRES